jgi:hypothetical protein
MQPHNPARLVNNPRSLLMEGYEPALAHLLRATGYVIQQNLLRDLSHVLRNCIPWLIEGPKGGGKTALADALAEGCNLPVFYLQGMEGLTLAGTLSSPWAAIYLRYRPEPLTIEVISIGQGPLDGPALIGRLITGTEEAASTTLFIARDRTHFTLPEAFASDAQLRAMNWTQEPLRERSFTPEERQQLEAWLQEQSTRERNARP